ncbi:SdpI family protein [Corynebacterium alimapuense]|uniref:SdpI family protein n=1 Tax=Corynebacterium alimapuense TaxID=1576874 RepID=A0A3M8K6H8_9CORY|nr:SdpI family protein [Corynebacterium alimapuense]RNE48104.1 hypothetical protein C5L39_09495 [Corynebacterium alimapuense]
MTMIGIILLILAAGLLVLGALASTKKLPGNPVVGLRVPEVRKSREAWDTAHAVAGPFWLVAGMALVFGGFFAFIASGWLWVLPAVSLLFAVVAVSFGANTGARMAVLYDSQAAEEAEGCGDSCNCGGEEPEQAPAPQVDLEALRRAADAADRP